ncbi:hypothetical protein EST38_g7490 [Candolleomyces aberdarensis]|uniref:Uncharacterized protein n=1 Tax=Candolleomyces aberdarensis TaxID=2316362 RepID=A0A4Q2DGS8_9AGAR|nr:hypothetical protein EST38_g7490 [Candolleomyces aberdarensis]
MKLTTRQTRNLRWWDLWNIEEMFCIDKEGGSSESVTEILMFRFQSLGFSVHSKYMTFV